MLSAPLNTLEAPFDDLCHALRMNRANTGRLLIRLGLERLGLSEVGPFRGDQVVQELQRILADPAYRKSNDLVLYANARNVTTAQVPKPQRRKF